MSGGTAAKQGADVQAPASSVGPTTAPDTRSRATRPTFGPVMQRVNHWSNPAWSVNESTHGR